VLIVLTKEENRILYCQTEKSFGEELFAFRTLLFILDQYNNLKSFRLQQISINSLMA